MGRVRKRHSAAFKAKVALGAVKQDGTIAEPAKLHQVHPVQISQWKMRLLEGPERIFENGSAGRRPDPEKLQVELYEQIGGSDGAGLGEKNLGADARAPQAMGRAGPRVSRGPPADAADR
ncbi:transposase [Planctomyces sp. SH-PL62]|uniref:transposase n=1 Tax=Planctomyces sp. SH-PL62 TaxID=1636152 RepID=UPI00078CB0FD|nr:hypothetical protein VT85_12445 [Planctomyces sp. SH-PL62]